MSDLFEIGSRWRHQRLDLEVSLRPGLDEGNFTLRVCGSDADIANAMGLTGGLWTPADIAQHFHPIIRTAWWDKLLEDDFGDEGS